MKFIDRTSDKTIDFINKMFNNLGETMSNLSGRWVDESEYEDIAEYQKVIEKELPKDITIISMTKGPFGFLFFVVSEPEKRFSIKMTEKGLYSWKRVK